LLFPSFLPPPYNPEYLANPGNKQIPAIDFSDNPHLSWIKFITQGDQYGKVVAGNTLADDSD
jgi:hypothetical protein